VTTAASARDALVRQISRPVRWEQSIRKMLADGVTLFVEIGPGRVLAGMIKRIDKAAACVNVESPADLPAARDAIRAQR
jgi:[acyl-carrier-protein] S-malonyltransferase